MSSLVHEPQQRRRVTRDVAALAAGLVVPELRRRDFLVPAVQGLHHDRLVLVGDAMDDNLAFFLELPHDVAHIFDTILVGQHGALVDVCSTQTVATCAACLLRLASVHSAPWPVNRPSPLPLPLSSACVVMAA